MAKTIPEYVKYSTGELDKYRNTSGSCVQKISAVLHIDIPPYGLSDINKSLAGFLSTQKVGSYDQSLKGIILDIHNIKVLPDSGAIRFDNPKVHVNVRGDCYVFQPAVGSIVRGAVRHVSSTQIGVIIYRVFSVSIRLIKRPKTPIEVDSEIDFKIKKYCLESSYPYIEGELVEKSLVDENRKSVKTEFADGDDTRALLELLDKVKKEEEMELQNETIENANTTIENETSMETAEIETPKKKKRVTMMESQTEGSPKKRKRSEKQ